MLDQNVLAIAAVAQVALLALNAAFIYYYLQATKDIADRNREQVGQTQKLVLEAQKQLEVSQEQIRISLREAEGQIRPLLVVDKGPRALAGDMVARNLVYVQNVGNGPALNLRVNILGDNQQMNPAAVSDVYFSAWNGICIEKGVNESRTPVTLPDHVFGKRLALRYESMSGKVYKTTVLLDNAGLVHATEFLQD
jgi:hypothetical protein